MNEIEFRRRAMSNPNHIDEKDLSLTLAQEQFLAESRELDERLRCALEVDIPKGIEDRVLLRHSFKTDDGKDGQEVVCLPSQKYRAVQRWAMAASFFAVVLTSWWLIPVNPALGPAVLVHVNEELHHLHEQQPNAGKKLEPLLASLGGRWNEDVLPVRYAGACRIHGKYGLHLVTEGELGPVTVLILPGEGVAATEYFQGSRFDGKVVRSGAGGMALIGDKDEDLERIEQRLGEALIWQS